ncbi:helix-turn-helix domain-containing protein [Spirosoma koreense]
MPKKNEAIPVNQFGDEDDYGIAFDKITVDDFFSPEDLEQSHRHDRHSFFLLETGTVSIEIDFQHYEVGPSSVVYMHPDQVHRILSFENVTVNSLAITNENLNPDYLNLLEAITPAEPLVIDPKTFSLISEAVSLCLKFAERKGDKLGRSILKDSCNALIALVASQYVDQSGSADKLPRFERITKAFKALLERNYTTAKRPTDYARKLAISTAYLNECVKNTTGHSVSYHIQQRVLLEAKRLLCYSTKSVKEIAAGLGYDDYPYFSRLFTKATGMTALAFRTRNLD